MIDGEPDKASAPRGALAGWLLALAPAVMLAILLQRPIWDVDIFWQLKLGEMILAKGSPIAVEPFSVSHLGEPLPAFAWLGQVLMAKVRLLSGWTGLRIFDALLWLGGFLAVAVACRRRDCSAAGVTLGLAIAFYIALPTASIRPQTFAVLGFGLLLALLRLELKPWRTALFALPLFLVWQNLHPSVSVAAVALGAWAGVDWMRWLLKRTAPPWETSILAVAAALMLLATPDGWSAIAFSAANARASAEMGVSEWLPLWNSANVGGILPIAMVTAIAAWLVARQPQRADLREIAVAAVFLVMTAFAARFVLFWAMAMIPVTARAVPPAVNPRRVPAAAAPLLLLAAAVLTPLLRPTYFSEGLPLAGIEKLRDSGAAGTIFAHVPWGGPLIDLGYPRWKVAYDGRFYRYTPEEWAFYRAIAQDKIPLAEVLRRYRPAGFVLDPEWNASLIAELRADPAWQQIWSDRTATVFKRR